MFYANMLLIQKHFETSDSFSFKTVEIKDIEKKLSILALKRQELIMEFLLKCYKTPKCFTSVI